MRSVHIRRALLLFAIVLGMAALVASISRPPPERSTTAPRKEPAPAPSTAQPAPADSPPRPVSFKPLRTRGVACGLAAPPRSRCRSTNPAAWSPRARADHQHRRAHARPLRGLPHAPGQVRDPLHPGGRGPEPAGGHTGRLLGRSGPLAGNDSTEGIDCPSSGGYIPVKQDGPRKTAPSLPASQTLGRDHRAAGALCRAAWSSSSVWTGQPRRGYGNLGDVMKRLATIGVYGFTDEFLRALSEADVRLLLDVRQRRGVRGPVRLGEREAPRGGAGRGGDRVSPPPGARPHHGVAPAAVPRGRPARRGQALPRELAPSTGGATSRDPRPGDLDELVADPDRRRLPCWSATRRPATARSSRIASPRSTACPVTHLRPVRGLTAAGPSFKIGGNA